MRTRDIVVLSDKKAAQGRRLHLKTNYPSAPIKWKNTDWYRTCDFLAADGLKEFMVGSYEEISAKMEEGTINRTVASTNMNATSSRAHTIVGITFIQKTRNSAGKEMAKGAILNLVDLAGRYSL